MQMLGNRVGVEKLKAASKSSSLMAMPEDTNSTGIIRYLGNTVQSESGLKVGQKVVFGSKREAVRIGGSDIHVMEIDNVFAILEEPTETK